MKRINVLWALPLILPFVFVLMLRLLWAMLVLPWEPDEGMAGFVVACGMVLSIVSAIVVATMQADGIGIWWTLKNKEQSDDG